MKNIIRSVFSISLLLASSLSLGMDVTSTSLITPAETVAIQNPLWDLVKNPEATYIFRVADARIISQETFSRAELLKIKKNIEEYFKSRPVRPRYTACLEFLMGRIDTAIFQLSSDVAPHK